MVTSLLNSLVVSLASYGYYGGDIGNMLSQLEQMGFFSYLLPFLLLFAVINGLLTQVDVFKGNSSINAIIAFSVSLMALQFDFVPRFFAEIFPRVGVGLAVILVLVIIMGLFSPTQSWFAWVTFGIGVVILAIILIQTAGSLGWSAGYWWYDMWPTVLMWTVIVILLIVLFTSGKPPSTVENKFTNLLQKAFQK